MSALRVLLTAIHVCIGCSQYRPLGPASHKKLMHLPLVPYVNVTRAGAGNLVLIPFAFGVVQQDLAQQAGGANDQNSHRTPKISASPLLSTAQIKRKQMQPGDELRIVLGLF